MSNDIVEVPFNGSMMIAQRFDDGEIYTALKPICENIGIDFNGQKQRLERTPWATMCVMHTVAADGKNRDMTAISRKTLTMWLATIDTNRLSDEQARHNVTVYQQEAAEALDKYFNEGGAIRVSDADSDEDIMARAVLVAQKTIERKNQQLQAKDEQIRELEPKAKALDDFTNVPDALLVRDAAKLLSNNSNIQIGEHELRQWLVDNGWIYRQSNQSWCAASSRVRQGHMVMVSSRSHGIHKDGTPFAYPPTPKLTRKGLALIHQRLSEQSFERVLDAEVAA
ncbi:phage antirepressor N-terminal domain-containing protein [Bifidobacterium adolescentis]|uniref:phage antirepressor N-terminal domain-containing protein n=1 Tax=Bifidobacterium adolescentis TaxID=1680 RepID=UPI0022E4E601|nr:phage antirepressor N-terminal domain-containing protein [Bifidobacterium adolescentis]